MCGVCDCDEATSTTSEAHSQSRRVSSSRAERTPSKTDDLARKNRQFLAERRVQMLNLIGAPGAGKTALLEATIRALRSQFELGVLGGDQATELDAARIARAGAPVVQITTGTGCHVDATMV